MNSDTKATCREALAFQRARLIEFLEKTHLHRIFDFPIARIDAALAELDALEQPQPAQPSTSEPAHCPFCGREAVITFTPEGDWLVYCSDVLECGTEGWYCDTREEAVAKWNKRTPQLSAPQPPAMPEDVREIVVTVLEDERDRHIINGGKAEHRKEIEAALAWLAQQQPTA